MNRSAGNHGVRFHVEFLVDDKGIKLFVGKQRFFYFLLLQQCLYAKEN